MSQLYTGVYRVQPFTFATVEASKMLEEIEASLQRLLKKGAP
jgi:hypothetical protein